MTTCIACNRNILATEGRHGRYHTACYFRYRRENGAATSATPDLATIVRNNRDQIEAWMRDAGWTPPGTNPFAK